jgi:hypothetical protein
MHTGKANWQKEGNKHGANADRIRVLICGGVAISFKKQ